MGLLDFLPDMLPDDPQKREAAKMGLLQLGAQMMGSRGNFGQSLGQGLLGGLQGYSQQMESGQQRQLRDMQIAQAKRAETLAQGQQQWMANMPKPQAEQINHQELVGDPNYQPTMTQPNQGDMQKWAMDGAQYNPAILTSMLRQIMPKPEEAFTLKPGETRFGVGGKAVASLPATIPSRIGTASPDKFTPESLAKFNQSGDFSHLVPVEKVPEKLIKDATGKWIPNPAWVEYENLTAPGKAPKVTVTNVASQETEQSKAYGKSLGETRSNIMAAAFNAPAQIAKLDRMVALLGDVYGGKLAPTAVQIASMANSVGLKIDPKLGDKEAAEALSREMAGNLRQPGTGPMTDKDFENFLLQMPDLSKSAQGRQQITATLRAKYARDIEIGKLTREYANKNGGVIDDGFMDIVSDYVAKNPVIQRTSTSGRDDQFPNASAIDAELRNRGRTGRSR